MNSASVAEESQFKLYSLAISFKTLSLTSPEGLAGESFSMICSKNQKKKKNPTSYASLLIQERISKHVNRKKLVLLLLTVRLTPESGRSSEETMINSFPYLVPKRFLS